MPAASRIGSWCTVNGTAPRVGGTRRAASDGPGCPGQPVRQPRSAMAGVGGLIGGVAGGGVGEIIPSMTLELINPEDLPTPPTYTHVAVATGSRLVFVAGQEPEDADGHLVGADDLAVQARQVFANLGRALAAAGARPEQVAKITIFVVDYQRDHLPVIEEARVALFGDHKPPDTLVGVETLSRPQFLIEVEAIAVVDA